MSSKFGWVDFAEEDRQKMLDVVQLFRERDTRDERGIGSISDLVPYWIFEPEDGYKVRRYTPILLLSRGKEHLQNMKRSLVAYRMVLGQPRQEDLVEHLQQRFKGNKDLGLMNSRSTKSGKENL